VADGEGISAIQSAVGGEWIAAMALSGGPDGCGAGAEQEHAGAVRQADAGVGGEGIGQSVEPIGGGGRSGIGERAGVGGVLFGRDVREGRSIFRWTGCCCAMECAR